MNANSQHPWNINYPVNNPTWNQAKANHAPNLVFVDDPFKRNINPRTSEGAKLYMKATASIEDDNKFNNNIKNAPK